MKFPKTPVQGRGFVRPENQNLQNFGEIIPIISGVIGGSETTIVSARALHKALGVGRVFRSWIKGRIEEYGFTEGVDYEVVEYLSRPDPVSAKSRQQTALEYIITVNMAKELAMVERTEQGRAGSPVLYQMRGGATQGCACSFRSVTPGTESPYHSCQLL